MRLQRSRYYDRLIVFAVCLIVLPIMAVGGFSYYRSSATVQEKVNGSALQMLKMTRQQVEQSLVTADSALTQFASSTTLPKVLSNDLVELNRSDNISLVNELREGLGRIKTYDLGPGDVQFLQLRYGWRLSTARGFERAAPGEPDWRTGIDVRLGAHWVIGEETVDFIKPIPVASLDPSAIVLLKIPHQDISRYLVPRQEIGKPFIYDRALRSVFATPPLPYGQESSLSSFARLIEDTGRAEGLIPVQLAGQSYNIIFSKSDYNGWTYASFISLDELTRESEAIKWFTIGVCLLVAGAGVVLSLPGMRSIYTPVRRLYEQVMPSPSGGAQASGKDEFEQIGERVRHYLLSQTRMSSELERQRKQLDDFLLLKLLLGEARPEEAAGLEEQAARWTDMNVIVVQIDTWEGTRYGENDRSLLLFAAGNIVSELVSPEHRLLQPIVTDQSVALLAGSDFNNREAHERWLDEAAGTIQRTIKEFLELPTSLGVSRSFAGIAGAGRAYKEALNALNYRIKLGYESILYMEDVSPTRHAVPEYPEKLKNELIDAIKLYERERAYELLRQFAGQMFSAQLSHRDYRMLLALLLADLLKVLREFGDLPEALLGEEKSLFDQIFELRTPDEMIRWFYERIIVPSIASLEGMKASQHRRISEEMLRMIREEYDTELTIEACAARINYHPDYVRHVFRRETGAPFGEYLAQHRLAVAKTWLAETHMKISEIAERLQYTNAQNFIRYFRKMEGMTPGQYRNAQYDADRR